METRARHLIVGVFVLLSFLGILGFFYWLAKSDLNYKVNYYSIYFKGAVTGLTIGGPVNYLGVPVGTIKNIELDCHNPECVSLTVAIKDTIVIKEDAYASLELQGLTGYKFVQIYGGSKDSPPLKKKPGQQYPVIPSRYSGVEELMTTLPRMINKFTNLIDHFNATFNEQNRSRLSNTLEHIESFAGHLVKMADPLHTLIHQTHNTLQTFDREMKHLSHSAEKTLKDIDATAQDIRSFVQDNRNALEILTQSGSYELIQTLKDTREMVTSATHFFEKLDKNPRSLLFTPQRKGVSLPRE